jgi:hypothetical protein
VGQSMKINSELTVEVVALGWDEARNREKELHRQAECSVLLEHHGARQNNTTLCSSVQGVVLVPAVWWQKIKFCL